MNTKLTEEIKDRRLTHLKGLLEMYLSSQILSIEIFKPLNSFLSESEINNLLSEKTGKMRNSIYRDKNTSVIYSMPMFFRYWNALLEIFENEKRDVRELPSLSDLVLKYKSLINTISQIEDEINLETAIENNFFVIGELVDFFRNQPLSQKNEKELLMKTLEQRDDIKEFLIEKRKKRMKQVD